MTVEATARAAMGPARVVPTAAPGVPASAPMRLVTDPLGRTGVTTGEAMAGATEDPARAEGSVKATIAVADPAMKGGATGGMTGGMGHEAKSAATDPVVGPPVPHPAHPVGGAARRTGTPASPAADGGSPRSAVEARD
jgi:hypothetical protein